MNALLQLAVRDSEQHKTILEKRVADLESALSDLVSLVEMQPEANDPGTDLWASVKIAQETLRGSL